MFSRPRFELSGLTMSDFTTINGGSSQADRVAIM